jgi:oligopeptide transport system substrate-binding protein
MRRWFTLPLLAAVCAVAFAACDRSAPQPSGKAAGAQKPGPSNPDDRTIRINIGTEPETLDLSLMQGVPEHKLAVHLCEGLVRLDSDARATPGVAERWESSEDRKTWTFHLRKDAKWHNGDAVTAKDFEFAMRRILNPKLAAPYADYAYRWLEGGEAFYTGDQSGPVPGMKFPDDHTIVFSLADPVPYFDVVVAHTSFYPLNQKFVEAQGTAYATKVEHFLGNGPFQLVTWNPRDRIIARKSSMYWGRDQVWFDEFVARMIEDENTELAAFDRGELDITNSTPTAEIDSLRKRPEFFRENYVGLYYVSFNTRRPPFDDARVREAFSLAIDRDIITQRITRRGELPAAGVIPRGITYPDGKDFRDVAGDVTPAPDAARAKALLAEAGYGPGKPFPRVTYLYNTLLLHKQVGERLQAMWKASLGVDVELQNVEWKEKLERGKAGDYDLGRYAWIADYPDPLTFLAIFTTRDGNNDGKYSNPEFDALVAKSKATADWEQRRAIAIEAEKVLMKDHAIAPVFFYAEPILVQTTVKGFVRNSLGTLDVSRARRGPAGS